MAKNHNDNTKKSGAKNEDRRVDFAHETSSNSDTKGDENCTAPAWIPLDQIDLTETGCLRECDNMQTVEEYAEVYRQHMQDGELIKVENQPGFPFPPCSVYKGCDGRWVLSAGRHRTLAAQKVGLKHVRCLVYSDEKEAIWDGLGDNRKNGLRNSAGDLRKMIVIALQQYPDKSHRLIAEHIGCSSSYVDKVAKDSEDQLPTGGQVPPTRTGRDGKEYPNQPSKRKKTAPEGAASVQPQKQPRVAASDSTSVAPNKSEEQILEVGEDKCLEEGTAPQTAETTPAPVATDIVTANALSQQHLKFFNEVPDDDEKRLSFSEMIVRHVLLGKFNDEQRRSELFQRIEALLQKFGSK